MSQIQTILAPLSNLLYANRNFTIAILCLVLGWVASYALINYWRNQRLVRELAQAKSDLSTSPAGRRYASAPAAQPEPVADQGGLPPIKGGRTYARNLGSALQKAGMTPPAQQIYSPPTHQGWPPAPTGGQPGPGMPPQAPPPYAAPSTPWGAPPQAAPWGYPAGANRSPIPPQPNPMPPLYQPQPPASMPGLYGPPPSFAGTGGMAPASPNTPSPFAPTPAPAMSAAAPVLPPVAPPPAPAAFAAPSATDNAAEPSQEAGRRGKPKRRRFNLSVLDNLEKIVQAKAAEVTRSVTPAAAPTVAPVTPASPPAEAAQPQPAVAAAPASGVVGQPAAADAAEPEVLPLQFAAATSEPPAVEPEAEPEAQPQPDPELTVVAPGEPEADAATQPEPTAEVSEAGPEPEPVAETTVEPVAEPEPQWRTSMRTMMFGEEAARAAQAPADEPEGTPAQGGSSGGEWTWGAMSTQREEAPAEAVSDAVAPSSPEPEAAAETPAVVDESSRDREPVAEAEPPTEPVAETVEQDAPSRETEPAYQNAAEPPAEIQSRKPSAGTLVIIEDDHTAADYYSTLFKGNGYQVEVANDGVSGVDVCVRVQPDVILLDVMMPRQNGILVLQTLRASDETRNTPVVVMSNFSEPTLIKRALQLGALEYVIKTQVEGPALLEALPRWMNREKAFAAA